MNLQKFFESAREEHPDQRSSSEEKIYQTVVSNIESSMRTMDIAALFNIGKQSSISQIVDSLLESAVKLGVSDIHIDPTEMYIIIRYRLDGIMYDIFLLPASLQDVLITRLKVLANLRTDEHAKTQDGRIRREMHGSLIDIRLSIMPTYFGENAVMRLLISGEESLNLSDIGLNRADYEKVVRAIYLPFGMILTTGPTGSGKTTTLYSVIKEINKRETSIITIEDPIEFSIPGITQIPVNQQTDLTFARGLRSIVRQDPDIIMVGEIRDSETASISVNASMTGHLLLSTLHTTEASVTLPRLLDMGIEPFLIASTVNVAIGQRLVRKLCSSCKKSHILTDAEKMVFADLTNKDLLSGKTFFEAQGCVDCNNRGYKGRVGIFEVLTVSENIRSLIMHRANANQIREVAVAEGMRTILEDGLLKAAAGITSIAEVMRVFHE